METAFVRGWSSGPIRKTHEAKRTIARRRRASDAPGINRSFAWWDWSGNRQGKNRSAMQESAVEQSSSSSWVYVWTFLACVLKTMLNPRLGKFNRTVQNSVETVLILHVHNTGHKRFVIPTEPTQYIPNAVEQHKIKCACFDKIRTGNKSTSLKSQRLSQKEANWRNYRGIICHLGTLGIIKHLYEI